MDRLQRLLRDLLHRSGQALSAANRRLGGIPLLLKRTLDAYNAHDGLFVSTAMAYFFFFSLFPLLLTLIVVGSLFLQTGQARAAVVRLVMQVIPIQADTIIQAIDLALAQRGTITILAIVSLIYSASGLFGVLLTIENRAWHCPAARSSLVQRLLALGLVIAFGVFFFLFALATTAFESLAAIAVANLGLSGQQLATAYVVVSALLSLAITTGLFLLLYWKLPATRVRFADAWPAAVAAGVAWEAARQLYAWYLSRFTNYVLIYGPFATIIGLLVWLNLSAYIILLGAELSVQIAAWRGRGPGACSR